MKQIAVAIPIYKKDHDKEPKNIIGLKVLPITEKGNPDFSQTGMVIWKQELNGVILAGMRVPVYESVPYSKNEKSD